jgi:membrane-associated phospholipid phosphatase/uncharacterized membrane protein (DUF485 family)
VQWFETLDVHLFRFINETLANPFFDLVMPILSGNAFFFPLVVVLGVVAVAKGRSRGIIFLLMLGIAVGLTDGVVCRNLKHFVGRERPFVALELVRQPGAKHRIEGTAPPVAETKGVAPADVISQKKSGSGSMPSSHAANWFAATMVAWVYYRRSAPVMLPLAALVSFSRIYNGVHFPSDVVAGAVLGGGTAVAALWGLNWCWLQAGKRWFPLWWEKLPDLTSVPVSRDSSDPEEEEFRPAPRGMGKLLPAKHVSVDDHWLRLGYLTVALILVGRLFYIHSAAIELGRDEAYQWLWSKHLALSYFSKPLLIAYTQFIGTSLWGDTAFGVRFFSPVITAVLSVLLLRFFRREVNARAGYLLLLITTSVPLVSVGSVLMTVDPLSVLFWSAAMVAGWKASQDQGQLRDWLWVGLWMGLGFLSKYTELFQLLCWAVFFVLWAPARKHLRRAGPYCALAINLIFALPVIIWNSQHHWATVGHVAENAGVDKAWQPAKALRYFFEFLGSELALLNPVFFVAMVWACIALWKRGRHNAKLIYFFSMGAPLFLIYLFYTVRSRVLPNWIAPSIPPLLCVMAIYWDTRWRLGLRAVKNWMIGGLVFGLTAVVLMHDTDIAAKLAGGHYLPANLDPLHRVRAWKETAQAAQAARLELLQEGKPVFIIADHYSLVGEFSFYIPEARSSVKTDPIVFYQTTAVPRNQFFFWKGYEDKKGQNAIFVTEMDPRKMVFRDPPPLIYQQFETVTDMGVRDVPYHGKSLRPLHIFACRNLR